MKNWIDMSLTSYRYLKTSQSPSVIKHSNSLARETETGKRQGEGCSELRSDKEACLTDIARPSLRAGNQQDQKG